MSILKYMRNQSGQTTIEFAAFVGFTAIALFFLISLAMPGGILNSTAVNEFNRLYANLGNIN